MPDFTDPSSRSPTRAPLRRVARAEDGRAARSAGPRIRGAHAAAFREGDPPLRAALSFQRVHQQLRLLRLLARQCHPARDARDRVRGEGGAASRGGRISQHLCSSRASIRSSSRAAISNAACARWRRRSRALALEVAPMETAEYAPLVAAGAEGLVVYQETYDRATYAEMHTAGPKTDFDWRLACPERAYAGGFRRIGIGALFGLSEWRAEALALAAHLEYLLRTLLEGAVHRQPAAAAPVRGQISRRASARRSRVRAAHLRVARLLSAGRASCSARARPALARRAAAARHHDDERRQPHRARRLHRRRAARICTSPCAARRSRPTRCSRRMRNATEQFEIADERSPAEIAALLRAARIRAGVEGLGPGDSRVVTISIER